MKHDPKPSIPHLLELIEAAEFRNHYTLGKDDLDFLLVSLSSFLETAIDKFIAGAKEHGDGNFVMEVNHAGELTKELVDAWFYSQAWTIKERKKQ